MPDPPAPDQRDSAVPPPPRPRRLTVTGPRAPGAYLPLSLWLRFTVAGVVSATLLAAMVLYVGSHNTNSPPASNPAAEVQANRDAEILIAQDQAPHVARARSGVRPAEAMRLAVRAYVGRQISFGSLSGPLRRAGCRADGSQGGLRSFRCRVVAGGVSYEFLGVVSASARQVTYCKRDPPPAPSDNIPVSRRCHV